MTATTDSPWQITSVFTARRAAESFFRCYERDRDQTLLPIYTGELIRDHSLIEGRDMAIEMVRERYGDEAATDISRRIVSLDRISAFRSGEQPVELIGSGETEG